MPLYKYVANRFLTAVENILLGFKLSEYHTGYRAFSRRVLETLPLDENSDDFVFDNQMLAQGRFGFRIGEISCPTKYFAEASSINFRRSVIYGFGVLGPARQFRRRSWGCTCPGFCAKTDGASMIRVPRSPGGRASRGGGATILPARRPSRTRSSASPAELTDLADRDVGEAEVRLPRYAQPHVPRIGAGETSPSRS